MDDFLTGVPRPEVTEGGHRAELKALLLQEAARPDAASPSPARWRRRLVWACVLAVALAGLGFVGRGAVRFLTVQSRTGPVTWEVSVGEEKYDDEITNLIADGRYELESIKQTELLPLYMYKFVRSNGRLEYIARPRPFGYSRDKADELQEIQNQIDQGSGELIGLGEYEGTDYYVYRYILADGQVSVVSDGRPYLGNEAQTYDEVKQLFAQGKAELVRPEPSTNRCCYRVVLNNGKPMLYFTYSPQPAK